MSNTRTKKDFLLTVLIAAVGFSIPFILYWNELVAGNTIINGDGMMMNAVNLAYLKQFLQTGGFPLWNPYLAGGMPQGITVGAPGLYPINWIVAFAPVLLQVYLYFAIHLAIGGAFMFRYLRKISCSRFVSTMVSVMYLFTVHMGGVRKEHMTLIVSALYVPVILFFAEQYLQRQRLKWLFLCAGAMALQFLGGFLQYVIYTDIVAFVYLLAGAVHRKWKIKAILARGVSWVLAYFGMVMLVVLPTAQFMLYLADSSGETMGFNSFKSFSLHPIKLLMAMIPELFGADVWSGLIQENYSSGMDVELLLGGAAIALLLASLTLCKKYFHVRIAAALLAGTLAYSCMGNLPLVAQIAYRIPALNMFRVPSRALFLATFTALVLIAFAMEEAGKESGFARRLNFANIAVIAIMVISGALYSFGVLPCEGERLPLWEVFKIPAMLLMIYLAVFYGYFFTQKKGMRRISVFRNAVFVTVVITMIIQVMPYYSYAYVSNVEENWSFSDEFIEEVGTNKVWTPDGSCRELVFNSAMTYPVQGLNAYTNLNLGNFYKYCMSTQTAPMNYSGLYNAFPVTENILYSKNDVASMMGAKYIMLAPETNAEDYVGVEVIGVDRIVVEQDQVKLAQADSYQVATFPADVASDKYCQISFTVESPKAGETVYAELNFGTEYHSAHAYYFSVKEGKLACTALFPPVGADAGDVTLRIVATTLEPLNITNVRLEEVSVEKKQQYRLVSHQNGYDIYENLFAKDLFYAAEKVTSISEAERAQLYLQTQSYDILNTSYVFEPGLDTECSVAQVEIGDIQLKNNSASAQVAAVDECFVNFSQTYYPGWKAFVDGKETELYEVNGLIQGCFVPEGEHTVEFRFVPFVFYIGAAITVATILICVVCACKEKRRIANQSPRLGVEREEQ